jgi:hypothetical protein
MDEQMRRNDAEFLKQLSATFEADRALYDEGFRRGILTREQWARRVRLAAREYRLARAERRQAQKEKVLYAQAREFDRARMLLRSVSGTVQ